WGENGDAVQFRAHPPAAPQIAVDIAAEAVGRALAEIGEIPAVLQLETVVGDVEHADRALRLSARLDDVKARFARREAETVRPADIVGDDRHLAAAAVDAVDAGDRQLGLGAIAFVLAADPERRVGEPDRAVGFDDDVIRRIERLALEAVAQGGDGAVVLGAAYLAAAMLAGDEAALTIAGVAVGI